VSTSQVASALGCTTYLVEQARQYRMDSYTTYLLIRIAVRTGATVTAIMQKRLNMGWDDVVQTYGITWPDIVEDLEYRMIALPPEWDTDDLIRRGASNNPDFWPNRGPVWRPHVGANLPQSRAEVCE
jgi:hypothetical protein